jgi:heterotetrameric sarcosine oxidase gamma subunit
MPQDRFQPYKVSAAYRAQLAQATWVTIDGWRVPERFGAPDEEAAAVRRSAGLQDVSALGKLDVKGRGVDAHAADCLGVEGVIAVLRLKPGHVVILTERQDDRVRDAVQQRFVQASGCAHLTDVSSALAAFALVGPRAADVLAGLTSIDLRPRALGDDAVAPCTIAHVHATLYRRDWGELRAYLMLVGRDAAEYVWTTVLHEGAHAGLVPFGTSAQQILQGSPAVAPLRASAVGAHAR